MEEESPGESETAIGADDETPPLIRVDEDNKSEFGYVKEVLENSDLIGKGNWRQSAAKQVVDSENERSGIGDDTLMFDLVNEVLLGVHERRSFCQGRRPSIGSGGALEEVWAEIRRLLRCRAEVCRTGGDVMRWDLANWDRWMELHGDEEGVAVEVEGLIFEDLLNEILTQ